MSEPYASPKEMGRSRSMTTIVAIIGTAIAAGVGVLWHGLHCLTMAIIRGIDDLGGRGRLK